MRYVISLALCLWTGAAAASELFGSMAGSRPDVVILGEVHDNAAHHARQAEMLRGINASAVVFEMLTPGEAAQLARTPRTPEDMAQASAGFHWGNIADYAEVLAASYGVIVGAALPRSDVRRAFAEGAAAVFGGGADAFALTQRVPQEQLELRAQLQFEAHCEAMPLEMMGGMVEAQRLRDAAFARTVLEALRAHGAPVVLITGNGHARKDWGVPAYLAAAAPEVSVLSVGQGEDGAAPPGGFDRVLDAPAAVRPDPCAAFQ